jgi:hypothetical protein
VSDRALNPPCPRSASVSADMPYAVATEPQATAAATVETTQLLQMTSHHKQETMPMTAGHSALLCD